MERLPVMGNVAIPFGARAPQRSRFGISVRKEYGADPRIREHRANMFRTAVLPAMEASSRKWAKALAGISGFFLLIAFSALASGGGGGAAVWVLILGSVLAWACYVLSRKRDLVLPAVNPFEHDRMHDHFRDTSEQAALDHLSWDRSEDVYASTQFESFDVARINEVLCMPERPDGFGLDPYEKVITIHAGQNQMGGMRLRFGIYRMHHIFATTRGLTYVHTEWNFVEDSVAHDGRQLVYATPRVLESNQWTWRTIENLHVGLHAFQIQTIGANRVSLSYIGAEDQNRQDLGLTGARPPEDGAYDWYWRTTAARQQRAARPRNQWMGPPGTPDPATTAPPIVHDPMIRQIVEQYEQAQREAAIRFVNTVNALRHEWEDRH